jgi:thiosulfate/3-mercaptopyruvate sulfurtransferase
VGVLPGPLVSADWLSGHLDDVVVADVRWYLDGRSGRAAYDAGHLPGAVFVDLDVDLADPPSVSGGRHPLPTPERFAASLSRLGIGDGVPVVAYDDAGGSVAARLWWMLWVLDHPAAVLDGGISAWTGPLSTRPAAAVPAELTPRPWPPDRLASADDVDRLRRDPSAVVLDARVAARYRGEPNDIDPRLGHVPGARSAPWPENLGPDGRLRAPVALRDRLRALGVGAGGVEEVVCYCGSGVTACHDVLALEVAGLGRARLYIASWSAWGGDPARPVATGDEPGGG